MGGFFYILIPIVKIEYLGKMMTKKLLAAGSILFLSLFLASCGASTETYFIGEDTKTATSSTDENDNAENAKKEIMKLKEKLIIEAEANITGPLKDLSNKMHQTPPDDWDGFKSFLIPLNINIDESTINVDTSTGFANATGTITFEGKEVLTEYTFNNLEGTWKLNDLVLTNSQGDKASYSALMEEALKAALKAEGK